MLLFSSRIHMLCPLISVLCCPGLRAQTADAQKSAAPNPAFTSWQSELYWQPRKPSLDDYKNKYVEKAKVFASQLTSSQTYQKDLRDIASKWRKEMMPDAQAMEGLGVKPTQYDPVVDMLSSFRSNTEDLVLTHTGLKSLTKGFSFRFNPTSWITKAPQPSNTVAKKDIIYTNQLVSITPDLSGPAIASTNEDEYSLLQHSPRAKIKWKLVPKQEQSEHLIARPEVSGASTSAPYEVDNIWDAVRFRSSDMSFLSMDFTGDVKTDGPFDPRKSLPNQTLRLRQISGLYAIEITGNIETFKPTSMHTLSAPLTNIFRYERQLDQAFELVKHGLHASAKIQSTYATSVYNLVKENKWELNFSQTNASQKLNFRLTLPSSFSNTVTTDASDKENVQISIERFL